MLYSAWRIEVQGLRAMDVFSALRRVFRFVMCLRYLDPPLDPRCGSPRRDALWGPGRLQTVARGCALLGGLWLAACGGLSPQLQPLAEDADAALHLASVMPCEIPASARSADAPSADAPSPLALVAALGKVQTQQLGIFGVRRGTPEPLFSPLQRRKLGTWIATYAWMLQRGECLRLRFTDRFLGQPTEVDIAPGDGTLVFRFRRLLWVRFGVDPRSPWVPRGELVAQAGQEVRQDGAISWLYLPLAEAAGSDEQHRRLRLQIVKQAERGTIDASIRQRLEAILARTARPSRAAWELFWKRWQLLREAHAAGLIDSAANQRQREMLIAALEGTTPRSP